MTERQSSLSAVEDERQRNSTAAAIRAVRKMIGDKIPLTTPVGRLNDDQLGWLVSSALVAWISKRAQQACEEGFDLQRVEDALRDCGTSPSPWDIGIVEMILPELADIPNVDWVSPLSTMPKEMMVRFLSRAFTLMQRSFAARDAGGTMVKPSSSNSVDRVMI